MITDLQCSSRVLRRSLRMHCLALAVAVGVKVKVNVIECMRREGEKRGKEMCHIRVIRDDKRKGCMNERGVGGRKERRK